MKPYMCLNNSIITRCAALNGAAKNRRSGFLWTPYPLLSLWQSRHISPSSRDGSGLNGNSVIEFPHLEHVQFPWTMGLRALPLCRPSLRTKQSRHFSSPTRLASGSNGNSVIAPPHFEHVQFPRTMGFVRPPLSLNAILRLK